MKNKVKQLLSEALGNNMTIGHYELQEWLTANLNIDNAETNSFISESIDNNFKEIYTLDELENICTTKEL